MDYFLGSFFITLFVIVGGFWYFYHQNTVGWQEPAQDEPEEIEDDYSMD